MYPFIRATSNTLAHLLLSQLEIDPILGPDFSAGGSLVVSLNNPEEMYGNNQRGISLWLYRVVRDDQLLNAPTRRPEPRFREARDLPLRLHYLLTPLADADPGTGPQTEQVLLGKALQVFHDHAVLRGSDLQEELTGEDLRLTVRLETLSLEEISKVWEALSRPYQLCVSYEVAVVPIRSARSAEMVAPIESLAPDYSVVIDSAGGF